MCAPGADLCRSAQGRDSTPAHAHSGHIAIVDTISTRNTSGTWASRVPEDLPYHQKTMIDRAGWPFILGALALAGGVWWWQGRLWAVPLFVLAAFFVFFFRDPERQVPNEPNLVVSPADARVMIVGNPGPGAPPGEWQRVGMFLSPMDVHVNRTPVEGRVTRVEYHPGKFLPAYREEAGTLNEWTELWIDYRGTPVVVRQIVGILARRIVCRAKPGDVVSRGQRFGIMKFGSRIDLFLPLSARLRVKVGDKVVGGETPIATLEP